MPQFIIRRLTEAEKKAHATECNYILIRLDNLAPDGVPMHLFGSMQSLQDYLEAYFRGAVVQWIVYAKK